MSACAALARPTAPDTAPPATAGEVEALAQRIFQADDRAPLVTWDELPDSAKADYREDAEIRLNARRTHVLTPKAEGEASRGGAGLDREAVKAAIVASTGAMKCPGVVMGEVDKIADAILVTAAKGVRHGT